MKRVLSWPALLKALLVLSICWGGVWPTCQTNCPCGPDDVCCYRVSENLPPGQALGQVTDSNSTATLQLVQNPAVQYTVTSNGLVSENIIVNKVTNNGDIVTNASLDREMEECFTVLIKVAAGGSQDSFVIAVLVLDENDNNPVFTETVQTGSLVHRASVQETIVTGELYCHNSLTANDADSGDNGTVSYSVVQPSGFSIVEEMDEDQVCLHNSVELDRETTPVINVTIQAEDHGTPQPLATLLTVELTLTDINDNPPVFHNPNTSPTILENATNGSLVASYNVTDSDVGANAEISFTTTHSLDPFPFFIDGATGSIFVCITNEQDIDVDRVNIIPSTYTFTLSARDNGIPSKTTSLGITITIANINDNPPAWMPITPVNTHFDEETVLDHSIVTLSLSDKDGDDTAFTAAITEGEEHCEVTSFNSNVFTVRVIGMLDRETEEQFNVTVVFSDNGSPNLTSRYHVTIHVNDINDNPPSLTQTHFTTTEDQPIGVLIDTLFCCFSDPDDGDNGAEGPYTSVDNPFLEVASSGDIRTMKRLDRETDGSAIELEVQISDRGTPPLSSNVTITITILDINDNSPVFQRPSYTFSITENMDSVENFGRVQAADADAGNNSEVRYSISTSANSFTVDPVTGNLSSLAPRDRELTPVITMVVTATDMGQPPLSTDVNVTITISDVNDNPPVFNLESVQFLVQSDARANSFVGQVSASDSDSEAVIVYMLNNVTYFNISTNGTIHTIRDLPNDNISLSLTVTAYNPDLPHFNSTLQVLVNITHTPPPTTNNNKLIIIIIGAVVGMALVMVAVAMVCCCCCCYCRKYCQHYDFVRGLPPPHSPSVMPRKSSLRAITPNGKDYSDANGSVADTISPSTTVNFSEDLRVRYYNREEAVINSEVQTQTVTIEEGEEMEGAEGVEEKGEAMESQSSETPTKEETPTEDIQISSPQLSEDLSSTSSVGDYPSPYYSQPPSNLRKELVQKHNQAYNNTLYPQTEPIAPYDTSAHAHEAMPHYPPTLEVPTSLHYTSMQGAHYPTAFNDSSEDGDDVATYKRDVTGYQRDRTSYQDEDRLKSYNYFSRRRSDQGVPTTRYAQNVTSPPSTDSSPTLHYTSNPHSIYYQRHSSHGRLSPPRRLYDQHYPPAVHINGSSLRHYSSSSSSSSRHTPLDMPLHYSHATHYRDHIPRVNGHMSSSEERQLRNRLPSGYAHPAILEKSLPPPIPYSYNSFASEDASTVASSVLDQYLQYEPQHSLIHDNLSLSVDDVKLSAMEVEKRQRD